MLSALLFCTSHGHAVELPETYLGQVKVKLCSQYRLGSTSLQLSYRIGSDPTPIPLVIVEQSIDVVRNEGVFQFHLPRSLGTVAMHIEAKCNTQQQLSPPSNAVSVSNCTFLSQEDRDRDGIPDHLEDVNCDNFYGVGDVSDPNNFDSDGDGVRDLVEIYEGGHPAHPGLSPRPFVYAGAPFDPDGDGNSNPVVWRPSNGYWYIRDFAAAGNHIGFPFGAAGDTPFVYQPKDATSNVGVIRQWGQYLLWFLNGPGFTFDNGVKANALWFGIYGDTIIPGAWEQRGVTNPAVARLFRDYWFFLIQQRDGGLRFVIWGRGGDIPKAQDYDGDGIFDVAVFRPETGQTYVIRSSDQAAAIYDFGSSSADHTVRGDVSGDGIDDIIFWEPQTGLYTTLLSDTGFNAALAKSHGAPYQEALQLGLFYVHVPLSWNTHNGRTMYTVVDHQWGLRYTRPFNDPNAPPSVAQWGILGDSLG